MSIGVLESGLALLPRLECFGVHTALVCGLGVPADRLAVLRALRTLHSVRCRL